MPENINSYEVVVGKPEGKRHIAKNLELMGAH